MNKYSIGFFDPLFDDDLFSFNKKVNYMRTDIKENETNYILEVELPGVNKENVSLKLNDGYLTVSYKHEAKEVDDKFVHQERYCSSMSRSFYVGDNIHEEDIEASYVDGILKITFPKKPEVKNVEKTIAIK
ncbi:MAG: Hsp20/alpha crystallin family protein [Bacilli bacterium]